MIIIYIKNKTMAISFAFVPCGTSDISETSFKPLLLGSKNFTDTTMELVVIQDNTILDTVRFQVNPGEMVFWNKSEEHTCYVPPPPDNGAPYLYVEVTPVGVVKTYVISGSGFPGSWFSETVVLYNNNL